MHGVGVAPVATGFFVHFSGGRCGSYALGSANASTSVSFGIQAAVTGTGCSVTTYAVCVAG